MAGEHGPDSGGGKFRFGLQKPEWPTLPDEAKNDPANPETIRLRELELEVLTGQKEASGD